MIRAATRRLRGRADLAAGALATLMLATGCGDTSASVTRVSVSGTVTLDGQPLSAGAIVFHGASSPTTGGDAVIAFGFVENGWYEIDADSGPAVGPARVEFRPKPLQRGELEDAVDEAAGSSRQRSPKTTVVAIPDKYGERSILTVQFTPGQNRHDFQLDSQP